MIDSELAMAPLVGARLAQAFWPFFAAALLPLLVWLPGRAIVALLGLDQVGGRIGRVILECATSLALMPLLLNPIWHYTNNGYVLLSAIVLSNIALALAARWGSRGGTIAGNPNGADGRSMQSGDRSRGAAAPWTQRAAICFAVGVVLIGTIGTYWPDENGAGPTPALVHDYIKHHAVLWSMQSHALPLGNPFYADAAREPAYYYHFFYLIPATLRAIVPQVDIALAFAIQSALVAISTAAMLGLIAGRFGGRGPAMLAFLLATIFGGFDIVPILLMRIPAITLDTWADTLLRVHNLLTQMVWTPQNVQGLLILCLAVYVLSHKRLWAGWWALGPLLGAALVGSTVWVFAIVAPALVLTVCILLWQMRRERARFVRTGLSAAGIAIVMGVLSAPSLLGYLEMSRRHGKGLTLEWPQHQSNALLGRLAPPGIFANLLDLPWIVLIEFGPLVILPVLAGRSVWRRVWNDPGGKLLLLSAALALAGFVSFRSHFTYNDFGQKISMVALLAGVVLGACAVSSESTCLSFANPLGLCMRDEGGGKPRRVARFLMYVSLVLGLPVALWQTPLAAIRRHGAASGPLARIASDSTRRASREASALRYLRDELPPDAVVQADWGAERLELQQMIGKQIGVMLLEQDTHVFQGRDASIQAQALAEIEAVCGGATDAAELHAVLKRHRVTHVFIGEVEREKWKQLDRFEDSRYFEVLDGKPSAVVARVR